MLCDHFIIIITLQIHKHHIVTLSPKFSSFRKSYKTRLESRAKGYLVKYERALYTAAARRAARRHTDDMDVLCRR